MNISVEKTKFLNSKLVHVFSKQIIVAINSFEFVINKSESSLLIVTINHFN